MKKHGFDEKRILAKGLLGDCPFKISLGNCPLKEIRKKTIRERLDIVNGMLEPALDDILAYHEKCQEERKAKGV